MHFNTSNNPDTCRDLINEGVIDVIAGILQSEDKKLLLTG